MNALVPSADSVRAGRHLLTVRRSTIDQETVERCAGATESLVELAANALLPHVPPGVTDRPRYAETGARTATRSGFYTLPGIRVEISRDPQAESR